MITNPPSRAQVETEKKGLPQSGTPGSDVIIDSLKTVTNPPSRAQESSGQKAIVK